mmetsp:Transcript_15464/g.18048  ORF Transcript_15464/g.18048 Transcript_15464/m.18048 type:complete len:125 (+) Transcript_15464:82-456(+)
MYSNVIVLRRIRMHESSSLLQILVKKWGMVRLNSYYLEPRGQISNPMHDPHVSQIGPQLSTTGAQMLEEHINGIDRIKRTLPTTASMADATELIRLSFFSMLLKPFSSNPSLLLVHPTSELAQR